jgi:predicted MFS family arabinose efflux permease
MMMMMMMLRSLQAAPIYLSEIAPTNLRGVLNAMFQLNITIGIFCANIVNFAVGYLKGSLSWRIALLGAGVPALMLTLGGLLLLESPISLIERGKLAQGRSILQKVRGKAQNVELEFEEMVRACEIAKSRDRSSSSAASSAVFRANNRPQLIISSLFAVFQQMTGINAIMFYAPVLFDTVGFKSNASLYSAAIIGGVNVASTIASMFVVERMGRKALLLEGGFQMILSQVLMISNMPMISSRILISS